MNKINYNTSRKWKQKIIVSNKSKKARTVNFCLYMPTQHTNSGVDKIKLEWQNLPGREIQILNLFKFASKNKANYRACSSADQSSTLIKAEWSVPVWVCVTQSVFWITVLLKSLFYSVKGFIKTSTWGDRFIYLLLVLGARLESVYTGNRIVGSNPTLSATNFTFWRIF